MCAFSHMFTLFVLHSSSLQSSVSPLIKRKFSAEPTTPTSSHPRRSSGGSTTGSTGGPSYPGSVSGSQLKRSSQAMGSTPDMRAKTPSRGRTGIPTPTSRIPLSGTPRSSKSRPTTPSNSSGQRIMRPKSTDPRRSLMNRPTSAKSDYTPGRYQNGQDSLMSQYALGRLSQLSYGDEGAECECVCVCVCVCVYMCMWSCMCTQVYVCAHIVISVHVYFLYCICT